MPRLAGRHVAIVPDLRGAEQSSKPEGGYDKKSLAQDIHALVTLLGYPAVKGVGHDIRLTVTCVHAAQYPDEVNRIVLMDAFLPGVGDWDWTHVWPLRDLWHFHFYGVAADRAHSMPEAARAFYAAEYARTGGMRAAFAYFRNFGQDAKDFAAFARTPLQIPMLELSGEKAGVPFLPNPSRTVSNAEQAPAPHWAGPAGCHSSHSAPPDRG